MLLFYLYYSRLPLSSFFFFFNDTATTEIYTLSLHDALPICTRDDAPAFILTAYGKPRTDKAFTNWFREAAHKAGDRKSTRLNSSHQIISYAVFCLKKKKKCRTRR